MYILNDEIQIIYLQKLKLNIEKLNETYSKNHLNFLKITPKTVKQHKIKYFRARRSRLIDSKIPHKYL